MKKHPAYLLSGKINRKHPPESEVVPDGTICALTGTPLAQGVPLHKAVTASFSRRLDVFSEATGYVSREVADCFSNDWNLGCRMIFQDGTHYHPLISSEQAIQKGRPAFRDLVRSVIYDHKGQECLIVLTTDVKKRVWHLARPGVLGDRTPIVVLSTEYNACESRMVNWSKLIAMLDAVEYLYGLCFHKRAIATNILRSSKDITQIGLKHALALEKKLKDLRMLPEFVPALIAAQKPHKQYLYKPELLT